MARTARKFVRVIKYLLAGVTIFCVSWIACVNEWHAGVRWRGPRESISTMRTIVAYSEGKRAELDRPSLVTCDRLPAFPNIPEFNRTWRRNESPKSQWQNVAGTSVSLYAAFYDDRTSQQYVRILAMFQGRNFPPETTLFCQTRSMNSYDESVEVVAAKPLEMWWHKWDNKSPNVFTPLLLSCPLTESLSGPSVVSIVSEPCEDPTNAFTIEPSHNTDNYERQFTICVKDMKFNKDISEKLIEWIETNKILGVDKIDIYIDSITKESEDVLLHYRNNGFIRLFHVPIYHEPNRTLWQRRRDHIVTYNDCLYRNIRESEYIIPLDVDEIVLPKIANTWPELLKRLKEKGYEPTEESGILIQNVFFFDFLQGFKTYERQIPKDSKFYVKRDDVRIKRTENLDFGEIELIGDSNSNYNEVIDVNDSNLEEKYKSRCGKELPVPKLARHVISSARVSPLGYYSKSLMVTKNVLSAFNHYALNSLGSTTFAGWPAPFEEVQLNHYKESCNTTVMAECAWYGRRARVDRSALKLWKPLAQAIANTICSPINAT